MTDLVIFIQTHGTVDAGSEAVVPGDATVGDLHDALARLGLVIDEEMLIFVDEDETHLPRERHHRPSSLHHGARVHVGHMREIRVAVNYLARTVERRFSPGTRVARVKAWAVAELKITPGDAAEHVLQLHESARKPSPDTPIHELVPHHDHRLCFDFVPEKRVEG